MCVALNYHLLRHTKQFSYGTVSRQQLFEDSFNSEYTASNIKKVCVNIFYIE